MGNVNMCRNDAGVQGKKKRGLNSKNKLNTLSFSNELIQEVDLPCDNINILVYNGYCATDKSDATINITDEQISRNGNDQECFMFENGGVELIRETTEYIERHEKLNFRLPFYTHAGDLAVSNVIHCTLSENKRTISDTQISQTIIECLKIADEELEASSISIPMIELRNYSLARISRIIVRAIKVYIDKAKRNRSQHLQFIKLISHNSHLQLAYMNAVQDAFQEAARTISLPRKLSTFEALSEKQLSYEENKESYIPSFKSDRSYMLHYDNEESEFDK